MTLDISFFTAERADADVDQWRRRNVDHDRHDHDMGTPPADRSREGSGSQLTPRQQEVLYLITKGCSNQEISETVGATIGTVKSHVAGILRALGVHSRTQAIHLVHENPDLLGQYRSMSSV